MSNIDDRLSRVFRAIELSPGFDARILAQVNAEKARDISDRAAAARLSAERSYEAANRNLRQWCRVALRMLTLDALGGATVLTLLLAALPRVLPQFAAYGPRYALALLALAITAAGVVGVVGVRFASLQVGAPTRLR